LSALCGLNVRTVMLVIDIWIIT